ncbi:MAG: hydroxyphenylacetyl-CoA thioesterase PaaI [Saprospiraceae bacterium]
MTNETRPLATRVVDVMMEGDAFSQWLQIERLEEGPGHCTLRMLVREEMVNGFHIAHGGISYALADSALAFASNAHGIKAVSIETSISHLRPVQVGDILTAMATEDNLGKRTGVYRVEVMNQQGRLVALFKGTVFRGGDPWFPEEIF